MPPPNAIAGARYSKGIRNSVCGLRIIRDNCSSWGATRVGSKSSFPSNRRPAARTTAAVTGHATSGGHRFALWLSRSAADSQEVLVARELIAAILRPEMLPHVFLQLGPGERA